MALFNPVSVSSSVTLLMSAQNARRFKTIMLQNVDDADSVALKMDGSADVLTSSNGILLKAGELLVLEEDKASFHNDIYGITASGTAVVRIQGIE